MSRKLEKKLPLAKYPELLKSALEARKLPKKPRLPKYANLPVEEFDWAPALERARQEEQNRKIEFEKFQNNNIKVAAAARMAAAATKTHPMSLKSIAYQKAKALGLPVKWSDSLSSINEQLSPKQITSIIQFPEAKYMFEISNDELTINKLNQPKTSNRSYRISHMIVYPTVDSMPDAKGINIYPNWKTEVKRAIRDFGVTEKNVNIRRSNDNKILYSTLPVKYTDIIKNGESLYDQVLFNLEYGDSLTPPIPIGIIIKELPMRSVNNLPNVLNARTRGTDTTMLKRIPDIMLDDMSEIALDCIPSALDNIIQDRKAQRKINKGFNLLAALKMDNRDAGTTLNNLFAMCHDKQISYGVCDPMYNIIAHHTFPNKLRGVYGMHVMTDDNNAHFYPIQSLNEIRRIFSNKIDDEHVCNDIRNRTEIKCSECKEIFVNSCSLFVHIEQTRHGDKRSICHIDDFITELNDYIERNNCVPKITRDMTQFEDQETIYKNAVTSVKIHGDYYHTYGDYGFTKIKSLVESQRSSCNGFLFDNYSTAFVKSYLDSEENPVSYKMVDNIHLTSYYPDSYEYDVCRFYTAIISTISVPVFSALDTIETFDPKKEKFTHGGFYLYKMMHKPAETDLIDTNNWLAAELAKFYYDNNSDWIVFTHKILPSKCVRLLPFVKSIYTNNSFSNDEKKNIVNETIGMMGKRCGTVKGIPHIVNTYELSQEVAISKVNKQPLKIITLSETQSLVRRDTEYQLMDSSKPAHTYIIMYGRYLMEKIKQQAEALGASVIAINTDGIYLNKPCELSTEKLLPTCYSDPLLISEKIGHFKPPKEVNKMPINYTQRTSIAVEEQVIKTNKWKKSVLKPNSSILITGMPGSGKSYTWKQFKKRLLDKGLKKNQIREMSFQNNVAADISEDAATLHKVFLLDIETGKTSQSLFKRFKKVKYIYVDEAQMMPSECVKILQWIKQNMPLVNIVLSGDFRQWPSIKTPFDINNENIRCLVDSKLQTVLGNKRIANKKYVAALMSSGEEAADYIRAQTGQLPPKYYITYYSNIKHDNNRSHINTAEYHRLFPSDKPTLEEMEVSRDKCVDRKCTDKCGHASTIAFLPHEGMPLVAIKSMKTKNIIKGRHYQFESSEDDAYTLSISEDFHAASNNKVQLSRDRFYEFFELGYAFTSHKTIGLTMKAPFCVLENVRKDVEETYYYVSLSRCNDPMQITLAKSYASVVQRCDIHAIIPSTYVGRNIMKKKTRTITEEVDYNINSLEFTNAQVSDDVAPSAQVSDEFEKIEFEKIEYDDSVFDMI